MQRVGQASGADEGGVGGTEGRERFGVGTGSEAGGDGGARAWVAGPRSRRTGAVSGMTDSSSRTRFVPEMRRPTRDARAPHARLGPSSSAEAYEGGVGASSTVRLVPQTRGMRTAHGGEMSELEARERSCRSRMRARRRRPRRRSKVCCVFSCRRFASWKSLRRAAERARREADPARRRGEGVAVALADADVRVQRCACAGGTARTRSFRRVCNSMTTVP